MKSLDTKDIQGLLIRGYKDLTESDFLLCQAPDGKRLKLFLKFLAPLITSGHANPGERAFNMAMTSEGMELLAPKMGKDFSIEFREGMVSPFRQRILGDYNSNAYENWDWGKPKDPDIHFILMMYASSKHRLKGCSDLVNSKVLEFGITVLRTLHSQKLPNEKEHFGFHDGISQPTLKGLVQKRTDHPNNIIADGEFIFGYENEYDKLPTSPTLTDGFNLGENGSYMVFRQIKQDVKGFWKYMMDKRNSEVKDAIQLASAIVGRYPSGTPLVLSPGSDKGDPALHSANNFGYYEHDKHGEKCPIGSHIRKANPRDGMNENPKESSIVSKRHRILRRGRPYGEPIAPSMDPEDIIKASGSETETGLYFICFNTNIGRQFEFIQQQWMNNKKFDHLYNDPDPLIGIDGKPPVNGIQKPDQLGEFTVQQCPVRKKLTDVPQFTFVKGGAYFFMPGLRAINKLAE